MAMRWCKPHNRFYPPDADACPRCAARAIHAAVRATDAVRTGMNAERCHTCWDLLEVCRCGELDRGFTTLIAGRRCGKQSALDALRREHGALFKAWDRMRDE